MSAVHSDWSIEEQVASGSMFLPCDSTSQKEALLSHALEQYEENFLETCVRISRFVPDLWTETALDDSLDAFKRLSAERRREIIAYPPLQVWCQQMLMLPTSRQEELRERLAHLRRMMRAKLAMGRLSGDITIPGTAVRVERHDLDALVDGRMHREFIFPGESAHSKAISGEVYPLEFFVEVATTALRRIEEAWPAAYQDFRVFVGMILHLTGVPYRSLSSRLYPGIIVLTTNDSSLLEVEESLLHEATHQALYRVMQFDRLVYSTLGDDFVLPWSGQHRDLDGYFHACCVYVVLASYFERNHGRSEDEQRRARAKLAHILRGLLQARDQLDALDRYTVVGRMYWENVKRQIDGLEKRQRAVLDEPGFEREQRAPREEAVRRLAADLARVQIGMGASSQILAGGTAP